MLIVYVAGPFYGPTDWDRQENVRRARVAGLEVAQMGCYPFIPHSNTCYYFGTQPEDFWVSGCLEMVRRSDMMLVLPGYENSKGTQAEMRVAEEKGIKVFLKLDHLWSWLRTCAKEFGLEGVNELEFTKYGNHLLEVQRRLADR